MLTNRTSRRFSVIVLSAAAVFAGCGGPYVSPSPSAPASASPPGANGTAPPQRPAIRPPGLDPSTAPVAPSAGPVATASPSAAANVTPRPFPGGTVSEGPSPAFTHAAFDDFPVYGFDVRHDGFNPDSLAFTPASLPSLHLAWQTALGNTGDYNTQGEPILATGIGRRRGVLYLGGGSGNVYAYDALSGAMLWKRFLGQETYSCQEGQLAYFGVGGSAAYRASSRSIYIVGNANSPEGPGGINTLYRLDAATGDVLGSTNFAPDPVGPSELDFSHTSVTIANGRAYVGTGATCDINSWRGRVAAVDLATMSLSATFFTTWAGAAQPWSGGGVWGWGGVSVDDSGNVLTGVGNTADYVTGRGPVVAPFTPAPSEDSAYGDSLTELSPDLATVVGFDHPYPADGYVNDSVDLDIAGTPVVFTPRGVGCDPEVAVQSKAGYLYLYDETRVSAGPIARYRLAPATYSDEFLGSPSYSPVTGLLYVATPSTPDSLFPPGMIAIDPECGAPTVAWTTPFGPDTSTDGYPRSAVSVSAGGIAFVGTICQATADGSCSVPGPSSGSGTARAQTRDPALCCSPPSKAGGAVWAVDASSGAVLDGGRPLLYTSGTLRAPVMLDGDWLNVLDTNGDLYALTVDPAIPAVPGRSAAIGKRVLQHWEPAPSGR